MPERSIRDVDRAGRRMQVHGHAGDARQVVAQDDQVVGVVVHREDHQVLARVQDVGRRIVEGSRWHSVAQGYRGEGRTSTRDVSVVRWRRPP
jgi:hypothetical protein